MMIAAHAIFDAKDYLSSDGDGTKTSRHARDFAIFRQGDLADALYYTTEGAIQIGAVSSTGKEAVIAVLSPGDFFGEGCLLDQSSRTMTATSMTPCAITRLDKETFGRILLLEPTLSALFLSRVLRLKVQLEEAFADQLSDSSEKLLARVLLRLAQDRSDGNISTAVGKISQETLAAMIGTTRSRVSYFMNQFRQAGLIDYNGHLVIHASLLKRYLEDRT